MSWTNFEKDIKNCSFEFTDSQLKRMRTNITELYSILKFVFDSPRRVQRPYSSVKNYQLKQERRFQSPDEFYSFKHENVLIFVQCRRKSLYSVACCGFTPLFREKVQKFGYEQTFSSGFDYYGSFTRFEFGECVKLFYDIVLEFISNERTPELAFTNEDLFNDNVS